MEMSHPFPPRRAFDAKNDYYEWLGVTKEATFAEVRKAYKSMCLKYHPDKMRQRGLALKLPGVTGRECDRKYEEKEAREVFLKLQEAFEILSDQATRRQYDRQRISEDELDKQYTFRANRSEGGWKPPKTWKPKVEDASKKQKKLKSANCDPRPGRFGKKIYRATKVFFFFALTTSPGAQQ